MQNVKVLIFKEIGNEEVGYLIALEENKNIPFEIKRIYYNYFVPKGIKRGGHSHKNLEQVLICLHGSILIRITDGGEEKKIKLNNPSEGLYIGPNIWRDMFDYNYNTVLLVLASDFYNEHDYIRNYDDFLRHVKK